MPDLMREQLGAYLDGELDGTSLQALQDHLETCQSCKEEIAALRRLSETLRKDPLPASLPGAILFSDALVQRLPPQLTHPARVPASRVSWQFPLGMLIALVFVQATSVLSMLVGFAGRIGLLGGIGAWFTDSSGQTLWFGAAQLVLQNMVSLRALFGLQIANDAVVSLQNWLITPLLWQSAVALAYLACLLIWWSRRQSSPAYQQVLE